jgi:hypothetical protein
MKQLYWIYMLALAVASCQHRTPPTQTVAVEPPPTTAAPAREEVNARRKQVAVADSLTPEMRNALRQVDVSKLFLAPESLQNAGYKSALDGFFGQNPQRLSLAILRVTRDSLQPELLHVAGKARYKKQVTAFAGDMRFMHLADYYDQGLLLTQGEDGFIQDTTSEAGNITNAKAYAGSATFRFTSQAPVAYVLTGQALLDFWIMNNGTVGVMHTPAEGIVLKEAATKGSGLVLKGNWQDASGAARSFLVSSDIFLLSPGLIADFGVGDRGTGVNPKYAKLGWNTFWENDEWWADTPTPKLSL